MRKKELKYIPTAIQMYFREIDFVKLYEQGKRIILTDLDNTLVSYYRLNAPQELTDFNAYLRKLGFKIYIVSNNHSIRVKKFIKTFPVDGYLARAHKPRLWRVNPFIHRNHINKDETVFIGDQILTDIKVANRLHIDSILVKSLVRSSEKWYTKVNRLREAAILQKIKIEDPVKFEQIERLNENE